MTNKLTQREENSTMLYREQYNKKSILQIVSPNGTFWDVDGLFDKDMTEFASIISSLDEDLTIQTGWLKGSKLTVFKNDDETQARWQDMLDQMNIGVNEDPTKLAKLPKRIARAFSPRDVAVKLTFDELQYLVVNFVDMGMTRGRYEEYAEAVKALGDGMGIIKMSFALRYAKEFGFSARDLKKAEALSFSAITPEGFLKALLYIVKDDEWAWGDNNVVLTSENVKSDMFTTDNSTVWMAFDVFKPYGNPKTNALLDVAMRHILHSADHRNMTNALLAELEKASHLIRTGQAVTMLNQLSLPQVDSILDGVASNKDFAVLPDTMRDFVMHNGDPLASPTLTNMMITAAEKQWWSTNKDWPKYPLICSWARPVICEASAALMGEFIKVERGEIRAIRDGHVWVVNDEDWMEFFTFNSGGADEDDHWFLIFRMVDGVRKVICVRIPCGWGEFNIMNFHDGDPFPEYVDFMGKEYSFPPMPGNITDTLAEMVSKESMVITGLPEADSLPLPTSYGPEFIRVVAEDVMMSSAGYLGQVINAVVLAMGTNPNTLRRIPATLEEIIDTFTQGGAGVSRSYLSNWGKDLVKQVASSGPVDELLWNKRSGRPRNVFHKGENGYWTGYFNTAKVMLSSFRTNMRNWHQGYLKTNNQLVKQVAEVFGTHPALVNSINSPVFNAARKIIQDYKSTRHLLNNRAMANEGRRTLTADEWTLLYTQVRNSLDTWTTSLPMAQLLCLAVWLLSMCEKDNVDDKLVINRECYDYFIGGLVNFGVLPEVHKMVEKARVDIEVMEYEDATVAGAADRSLITKWNRVCPSCGKTAMTTNRFSYVQWLQADDMRCSSCRGAA